MQPRAADSPPPPPNRISVPLPLDAILLYFVSKRQVTKQHTSKMTPLYIPLIHALIANYKQFIIHL